jgi:Rrf2 family protein
MLSLTRRVDYGLIAMLHFIRSGAGAVSSARDISEQYHIPRFLLANILKGMHKHGFIRSVRGTKGGYCIEPGAENVSIARFIQTLEGPIRVADCTGDEQETECEISTWCPVREPVREIHRRIMKLLDGMTFADLAPVCEAPEAQGNLIPVSSFFTRKKG